MPPTPPADGPVRPPDVVNELIRALFRRVGGRLYGEDKEEYDRLIAEWTLAVAAKRVEIVEAA